MTWGRYWQSRRRKQEKSWHALRNGKPLCHHWSVAGSDPVELSEAEPEKICRRCREQIAIANQYIGPEAPRQKAAVA